MVVSAGFVCAANAEPRRGAMRLYVGARRPVPQFLGAWVLIGLLSRTRNANHSCLKSGRVPARPFRSEPTPVSICGVARFVCEPLSEWPLLGCDYGCWGSMAGVEREVKMALRKTLFKYKLHQDQELFDRAYGYIRQYY